MFNRLVVFWVVSLRWCGINEMFLFCDKVSMMLYSVFLIGLGSVIGCLVLLYMEILGVLSIFSKEVMFCGLWGGSIVCFWIVVVM